MTEEKYRDKPILGVRMLLFTMAIMTKVINDADDNDDDDGSRLLS